MKTRILFGSLLIAATLGLVALDAWLEARAGPALRALPIVLLVLALAAGAFAEVSRLAAAATGARPLPLAALAGTAVVATLPYWHGLLPPGPAGRAAALLLPAGVLAAAFLEQMARRRTAGGLGRVAVTVLAVGYLGVGGALVLAVRLDHGLGALLLLLAAAKCTDIGAYFTGSAVGRHKLIRWLSPHKSWEGLAGGLAAGAGACVLVAWLWPGAALGLGAAAAFGVAVGLAGQFGDLCESLLKRAANQKDSAALVPSFGGVLDIIDSPLGAAPVAYLLLLWLR